MFVVLNNLYFTGTMLMPLTVCKLWYEDDSCGNLGNLNNSIENYITYKKTWDVY